MPMWVSTHPCPDRNGISPPCFLMRVTAYGEQAYFVLSLNDTRALIADLTEQADRLAAEQALIDAETVYGATA